MRLLLILLVAVCAVGVRADRYHPAVRRGRAAVSLDENDPQYWANEARVSIEARAKRLAPSGKARNVVMFLGDGMSIATMSAARALLGQRQGNPGEEAEMFFEGFPTVGLSKTYCVDVQVADSACTSTAYLCGVKTNEAMLGLNAGVPRFDCVGGRDEANFVSSIAEWALDDGRDTGFVTTTRVTHASPAGLYAKSADRDWETDEDIEKSGYNATTCPDITQQLVNMYPGNKFKVILGGGRRTFVPNTQNDDGGVPGFRTDGRNLIEEWQQDKRDRGVTFNYVANRTQLMAVNENLPEYLLGLFESGHMSYHVEAEGTDEPTLAELTATAIKMLSRNEKGFFLFVEGGRIDHAHHDNFVLQALDETLEMDKAVAVAAEMLDEEDSLIVVTADHAHVMAFNGYQGRGQDILGVAMEDRDGVPLMTLSYANGPGFRSHESTGVRPDVTAEGNFGEKRWRSHVDAPLDSETHGGDDVAVFAWGTYHSLFTGLYEQSQIPYRMAYAACIGPGLHSCNGAGRVVQAPLAITLLALVAMLFAQRS